MKLIIDRGSTKKGFYSIQFGVDFDTLIFSEKIWISGLNPKIISNIDMIVTKSAELKWCVLYIKHPLLLEHGDRPSTNSFFEDENARHTLREYFTVRLMHRRFSVDLYEIGKRLF